MTRSLILIVEDDVALRSMLRLLLESNHFVVQEAVDAEQAKRCLNQKIPSLILLDWMLPGISGAAFARNIKAHPVMADIPIIMLTAKGEEEDKVRGLESGADDYVTKPFSNKELVARVRAALRRSAPHEGEAPLEYAGIVIDPTRHAVEVCGQAVELGIKEFSLLYFFMNNPGRVFSRQKLLDKVWGRNAYIEERTVDVYVRRLRSALEQYGFDKIIKTVRGVGYRLASEKFSPGPEKAASSRRATHQH